MDALHHDAGLRLPDDLRLLRHTLDVVQDILVRDIGLILLMLELDELCDDLRLLEAATTDGCQHGLPVGVAVTADDALDILRLRQLAEIVAL